MSEPNRNNRTIKEIITDATDRELEDYEAGLMTPEKLRSMAAAENRRKKLRYRKIAGLAALFLVVIVSAVMVFNSMTSDVDADKNHKEEIITDDGVVIEDGGWGSSSEDNWEITEWKDIKLVKESINELIIPEYIPEGYIFKSFKAEEEKNIVNVEYIFNNNKKEELIIQQYIHGEKLEATTVYDSDKSVVCNKGTIYIKKYTENDKAIIQLDDGIIIQIWNKLSDYDIVKIVENIKY